MLARSDGYWWPALADRADRADSDLGIEVGQRALPALAADSTDDRRGLFVAAAARFATALDLEPAGWPVPDLSGEGSGQVLAVHMAALATVDATRHDEAPPTQSGTVSAYLLRRELAYWYQLHTRTELPMHSPPGVMHRAVVAASLTGSQPRKQARHALADAGVVASGIATDQIIDDHITCYPPADTRTVFEPLHPDRLGEDLIALSTPGRAHHGIGDPHLALTCADLRPGRAAHITCADRAPLATTAVSGYRGGGHLGASALRQVSARVRGPERLRWTRL